MAEQWRNSSVSDFVSETMSRVGYSLPMVNLRRKSICYMYQQQCSEKLLVRLTGSKAEGISKFFECDTDILGAPRNIISTTTDDKCKHLLLDRRDCPPGYTKLSFLRVDRFCIVLHMFAPNSIITYNGKCYFGSAAWKFFFRILYNFSSHESVEDYVLEEMSGPSNPLTVFCLLQENIQVQMKVDSVAGIICDCPDILQPWIDRPRNNWPPYKVIRDISQMEAYVVPVGHVTSDMQGIEWRICFTRAEHRLIDSFNDCHIKLLVLLKMISKTYLKPLCKEMTSYVMKNVVCWLLEKHPVTLFEGNNLLKAVKFALTSLRNFIQSNYLPNYMIPERNLLADKVEVSERHQLCLQIEYLLRAGPRILLRCDKIGSALYALNSCPRFFFALTQLQFLIELIVCRAMVSNIQDLDEIITRSGMRQVFETMVKSNDFSLAFCLLY